MLTMGLPLKEKGRARRRSGGPVPQRRIPLTGADGQPVLLDDLPPGVRAVAQAISGGLDAPEPRRIPARTVYCCYQCDDWYLDSIMKSARSSSAERTPRSKIAHLPARNRPQECLIMIFGRRKITILQIIDGHLP
jgi:hypothetical protein